MPLKIAICLMRNALRFADNELLYYAHHNADYVVPLYCFDPRDYKGTYHYNFPKTGSFRTKFLLDAVSDLRLTLQKHGSNLIVRQGKPEAILSELIQQIRGDSQTDILFQEEPPTKEEKDLETAVRAIHGATVKSIWGSTLYHKDDVPFKAPEVPDVFSVFRKEVENQSRVRPLLDMPQTLKPMPEYIDLGNIPTFAEVGIEAPKEDARTAFPFAGGESTANERLDYYLWGTDKVAEYIDTRNGMIGSDFSTKFSPWLALGCISPRYIYWEIKRYEKQRTANKSTYWVIFEMIWRDFFKYVALKYGDRIFYKSGIRGKYVDWKKDTVSFNKWCEGKTGVPYVDANMRELAQTGFMSNRGRQNVASFLTKDLKLDWRLGAEWFESLLLDHDVCSNYGNWQYSAGIGNDPRQDRKFNMIKQGTDYDPNGDYIRLWVPELGSIRGRDVHVPWTLTSHRLSSANVFLGEAYPRPIVIAPEWGKHIHSGAQGGGKNSKQPGSRKPQSANSMKSQRGIDYYFQGQQ